MRRLYSEPTGLTRKTARLELAKRLGAYLAFMVEIGFIGSPKEAKEGLMLAVLDWR